MSPDEQDHLRYQEFDELSDEPARHRGRHRRPRRVLMMVMVAVAILGVGGAAAAISTFFLPGGDPSTVADGPTRLTATDVGNKVGPTVDTTEVTPARSPSTSRTPSATATASTPGKRTAPAGTPSRRPDPKPTRTSAGTPTTTPDPVRRKSTPTPSRPPAPRNTPRPDPTTPEPHREPRTTTPPTPPPSSQETAYENAVVSLTNAARSDAGCGPLRSDERLRTAARGHSADMAARDYFDHNSPDGRTPWDRIEAAGYDAPAAENIAGGQPTPQAVVDAWMNSEGHRANILNCKIKAIGVGVHLGEGGPGWTQDFGYN
ncbi:CAP domain-containing protein [Actinopolymorpha pittospori]|uniref:Uncharacterized protein YkwD n=1 Tax=Actinopolymorpha pittospori TaxID=648752 RepID=A0A927RPB6_9ACTN|nr:CAP domain-containing protein [Actinopolymorpha pittospori]MBE1611956.1 uncharacterized protein YkwD [Actinopolymorpha pittospori]